MAVKSKVPGTVSRLSISNSCVMISIPLLLARRMAPASKRWCRCVGKKAKGLLKGSTKKVGTKNHQHRALNFFFKQFPKSWMIMTLKLKRNQQSSATFPFGLSAPPKPPFVAASNLRSSTWMSSPNFSARRSWRVCGVETQLVILCSLSHVAEIYM